MPTYSLLGATGGTGSAILRALLTSPPTDLTLNILIRNKEKLLKAFPGLEETSSIKVLIHEGTPSDSATLQKALAGAEVVFACIATNTSIPGVSIALDTAQAIIAVLEKEREDQGPAYKTPTILQLRSASLNSVFADQYSWIQHRVVTFCLEYVYADLRRACDLFTSKASEGSSPKLLALIIVDPPAIHSPEVTEPTGHELITDGKQSQVLNYADLGVAFVEIARKKEEYAGLAVAVSATGKVEENWPPLAANLFVGARARIIGW